MESTVDQTEFAALIADGRRIEDDLKATTAALRALSASNYRNCARIARTYLDDQVASEGYEQAAERLSGDDTTGQWCDDLDAERLSCDDGDGR